ncbi:MAG: FtsX-like permease family protein, partial [Ktedonobacterales bacterium]
LSAQRPGLTPLLAFSQVERNPSRYSRLALLLVLAVGLGLFALAFNSSLTTNGYDRAAYSVGSDIRFRAITDSDDDGLGTSGTSILMQRLQNLPGVLGVTPVFRGQVSTTSDEGGEQVDALGIDPATFERDAGVVSWRNDYASTSLNTLLSEMRTHSHGSDAGAAGAPIWAIVSTQFASRYQVKVGDPFSLEVGDAAFSSTFVVGAIANEFPTLYPGDVPGGFIVVDLNDYLSALRNNAPSGVDPGTFSANEFWMRTTASPSQHAALLSDLANPNLLPQQNAEVQTYSLAEQASQIASNPVSAGMRGLLLIGALTAAVLAVIGSIVQGLLATEQRSQQFAVMRTVGMSGRQLTLVLLGEQVVVYFFGLVGGTLLGLLLVTATLPFLQFSDTTINPTTVGVPPYILTFDGQSILYFYVALFMAFLVALLAASRYASSIGLGDALRLGED